MPGSIRRSLTGSLGGRGESVNTPFGFPGDRSSHQDSSVSCESVDTPLPDCNRRSVIVQGAAAGGAILPLMDATGVLREGL